MGVKGWRDFQNVSTMLRAVRELEGRGFGSIVNVNGVREWSKSIVLALVEASA